MILPTPVDLVPAAGRFTLTERTTVRADGDAAPVADLLRTLLRPATGLPLAPGADGTVALTLDPAERELGAEGYRLTVDPFQVTLHAARPAGLRHAVQTLRQLLPPEALSARPAPGVEWSLPAVRIVDRPRHAWRGFMIDTARHFQPIDRLLAAVDRIALHKLNVLHLHLTDDQGWRLPVDAYPRLTEIGAGRTRSMLGHAGSTRYDDLPHQGAYTKAELRHLVAYAAERGVTVVPEIDMPGHTRAALAAYPQLGNHPERQLDVWTEWGVCETVLGVHEEVFAFCRAVLDETMELFPSRYVHLGGDECPTVEWETSPAARRKAAELGLAEPAHLRGWFLGRVGRHLLEAGRIPMCWAEADGSTLPVEFTVMPWRDAEHGREAARRGHDIVMAPHRATYLDYPQSEHPEEPLGQAEYVVDLPTAHAHLAAPEHWGEDERAKVLGTQAQLWSEFVTTAEHFDYLAYPRLCAIADRAWNPASDYDRDFLPALAAHRPRLAALGVHHAERG
ncbi:beta-N-acetylhexosaminidase [Streptomyces sp. TLI_171]|uniref:beta-N-acetylhexosaminidase n=1 Tax=Streptomyces sp. TLI_171 TaxID=1938859 RepID=UPI000C19DC35|nr:beta-N-acetylhexosaminidase [Streptomyces sp. TLI_171]RKE16912.1 hexosaminidase [Streptomyces sp. TLI_171]